MDHSVAEQAVHWGSLANSSLLQQLIDAALGDDGSLPRLLERFVPEALAYFRSSYPRSGTSLSIGFGPSLLDALLCVDQRRNDAAPSLRESRFLNLRIKVGRK